MLVGMLIALLVAGFAIAAHFNLLAGTEPADIRRTIANVQALPHLRLSFVCVYAVAAASGVPATALTLSGGVLFGPATGMILSWISDMLAASISFGVTRALVKSFGRDRLRSYPIPPARGFLGLLRLRVIPVVPFALLNYGSALYGVRWSTYLGATALGVVPTTVVYVLLASSVVAGIAGAGRRALLTAAIAGAAVIGLSLLPRMVWKDTAESETRT